MKTSFIITAFATILTLLSSTISAAGLRANALGETQAEILESIILKGTQAAEVFLKEATKKETNKKVLRKGAEKAARTEFVKVAQQLSDEVSGNLVYFKRVLQPKEYRKLLRSQHILDAAVMYPRLYNVEARLAVDKTVIGDIASVKLFRPVSALKYGLLAAAVVGGTTAVALNTAKALKKQQPSPSPPSESAPKELTKLR